MKTVIETQDLTKRFDQVTALDSISLNVSGPSIIGMLGKNGSGKTTLIQQILGLHLPTEGHVWTLDKSSAELGHQEMIHIGYVPQEIRLLDWMSVGRHLHYVSTFYPNWDEERQQRLLEELELSSDTAVGTLSQGNLQKLAIILAVCHHPKLLVLDEPISDLDPIVRSKLLEFLLELMREDDATIIISSHVLRDVEKVVDRVVVLDQGQLVMDASLDDIKELYSEWLVVSSKHKLPGKFSESFVVAQQINGREARLLVRNADSEMAGFRAAHAVDVSVRALNLEEIFPVLIGEEL